MSTEQTRRCSASGERRSRFFYTKHPEPTTDHRPPTTLGKKGLTLIEVMIALAILSIGLFVLIATASRCLGVARQARHYEKARHLISRVELEHPLQLEEEITEGIDSGGFQGEGSDYRWTRAINLVGDEEEEDGLYHVTIRVYWSDRGKEAYEEVVTYLYAPEEVEGGSFERPAP